MSYDSNAAMKQFVENANLYPKKNQRISTSIMALPIWLPQ
jgi:hypothetical protein